MPYPFNKAPLSALVMKVKVSLQRASLTPLYTLCLCSFSGPSSVSVYPKSVVTQGRSKVTPSVI